MSEQLTQLRNTDFYVKEEVTEGILITNTNSDAIKITQDSLDANLNRELLENMYLNSHLGRDAPQPGMWSDDLGGAVGLYARGGASTPQPDCHVWLKCLFGSEVTQAADTVAAGTLTLSAYKRIRAYLVSRVYCRLILAHRATFMCGHPRQKTLSRQTRSRLRIPMYSRIPAIQHVQCTPSLSMMSIQNIWPMPGVGHEPLMPILPLDSESPLYLHSQD